MKRKQTEPLSQHDPKLPLPLGEDRGEGVSVGVASSTPLPQPFSQRVSLNNSKDSLLFFCLTALMREFVDNKFTIDYEGAKEGIEDVCFDRCIEIIKRALDPAVQQVTEGIARTSLSS